MNTPKQRDRKIEYIMVKNSQLSTLVELFQDFGRRGAVRVEGYEQ